VADLDEHDFADYFEAVHGTPPFVWQRRLLAGVLESRHWPSVVDLPTGVGKTAALDVALFALACDPAVFPRRIVFVVDRRLVVDQVVVRGRAITRALSDPSTSVTALVAQRLRALAGGSAPLHVASLRGGVMVDNAWARWPDQPCLLVSTVDQFGSRLLFRGYGVSDIMRAVHAGLAGSDCLVLLDEVHLSRPFAETLEAITTRYRRGSLLPDRWQVVEMSATPRGAGATVFRLESSDFEPEISRRVRAPKSATLKLTGKPKQPAWDALPAACEAVLSDLHEQARTIAIVVNRVRSAREIWRRLDGDGRGVTLLTGRMRPFDRQDVIDSVVARLDPDRPGDAAADRVVVVATQCIEVGADFSFDAMVTECAPIDALRQRFGRLDRRGHVWETTGVPAPAVIIGVRGDLDAADDPVYGPAVGATWHALHDAHADRPFDVGALSAELAPDGKMLAPVLQAPLLLPSHLDAFVQTSPRLRVEPDVAPFLHGLDEERNVDVRVVWRADLVLDDLSPGAPASPETVELLSVCPPRGEESIAVPLYAVRAWLSSQDEEPVSDAGSAAANLDGAIGEGRTALCWRGIDDVVAVGAGDLRAGDLVIVPSSYGGLSAGNWDPSSPEPVDDFGDRAQLAHRRKVTLRLDPRVLPIGLPAPPIPPEEDEQLVPDRALVEDWLAAVQAWCEESDNVQGWFRDVIDCLSSPRLDVRRIGKSPVFVLVAPFASTTRSSVDPDLLDGSDEANSFTGTGVTLTQHLEGVGRTARRFAESLDLPGDVADDLELAGRLHDLGKADPRFQLLLHNGDEVAAVCAPELLAKSRSDQSPGRARGRRTYPVGMRHELLSVALAQSCQELLAGAHDVDLVLHLVASHHGYCRPLPPVVADPLPLLVDIAFDGHQLSASSQLHPDAVGLVTSERFWRVVERYGWFGAAWLEAIFRLADHRRSGAEASAEMQGTAKAHG